GGSRLVQLRQRCRLVRSRRVRAAVSARDRPREPSDLCALARLRTPIRVSRFGAVVEPKRDRPCGRGCAGSLSLTFKRGADLVREPLLNPFGVRVSGGLDSLEDLPPARKVLDAFLIVIQQTLQVRYDARRHIAGRVL